MKREEQLCVLCLHRSFVCCGHPPSSSLYGHVESFGLRAGGCETFVAEVVACSIYNGPILQQTPLVRRSQITLMCLFQTSVIHCNCQMKHLPKVPLDR